MAGPNYVLDLPFVAGAALTQFTLVTLDAGGLVTAAAAQGERVIGVVQESCTAQDATDGRVVSVRVLGASRAKIGATLATLGVPVTAGADARVEAAITGDAVFGIFLGPSAVDGDLADVLVLPVGNIIV